MWNGIYKYGFFLLLTGVLIFAGKQLKSHLDERSYQEERAQKEFQRFKKELPKYFVDRNNLFKAMKHDTSDIVFLGDSHFQFFELNEFLDQPRLLNRGISGDISIGVYNRIDEIVDGQVNQLFFLIGTNDLIRRLPVDSTIEYIGKTLNRFISESPKTKIYLHTVFPMNTNLTPHPNFNEQVLLLNKKIEKIANEYDQITLIDLYQAFTDDRILKLEYTYDGIHLNHNGYLKWAEIIKKYLNA